MHGTTYDGDGDRRHYPRVTVSVPFRLYARDSRLLMRARTLDLSTHGALLHGACTVPIGDRVNVEVPRGTSRNPLRLDAEVVRIAEPGEHRRHHGVAVRFMNVSKLDEAVLATIIDEAKS